MAIVKKLKPNSHARIGGYLLLYEKNPVLYLSNKAVFTKIAYKLPFFRIFGDFCVLRPYTTFPMAVTAIYMIISAWRCFIINKTRKILVL